MHQNDVTERANGRELRRVNALPGHERLQAAHDLIASLQDDCISPLPACFMQKLAASTHPNRFAG